LTLPALKIIIIITLNREISLSAKKVGHSLVIKDWNTISWMFIIGKEFSIFLRKISQTFTVRAD
jgi:hypothetical protein